jgi:excisionase family DNA binding protein
MLVLDGVEMLDVREVARLAGRTPETVRRWIWSGRLTARRHGGKLLVARKAVEDLTRGSATPVAPTLAEWARAVESQRRAGTLGDATAVASAADLVLADRSTRQAS